MGAGGREPLPNHRIDVTGLELTKFARRMTFFCRYGPAD
jgi:hypothetical protein